MKSRIRKVVTLLEETHIEGGRKLTEPTKRAASVAVIANPYASGYVEDLSLLSEIGEELGDLLTNRAVSILGIAGKDAESFGKAAIVGAEGELEHAAAILHPRLGAPLRQVLGGGPALIPSSKKRAAMGSPIDIPLGHKDAAKVRSHFDGMEVRIPDAPRDDEILVAISITNSGRPLPRVGGLTKDQIKGENGID
ncbi:amino acid synthesis family protein [Brucella sp. 21LCYQ03]|nr:amino acid synthesis family protein [Brucella sp. 21LCYQ03]